MCYIDEPSHPDSPLEWWFIHGWFQGAGVGKSYFMATLFRFEIRDDGGPARNAFGTLISVLDAAAAQPRLACRIDRTFLEARWPQSSTASIDAYLSRAALGELRKLGLPAGVECPEDSPVMSDGRLQFAWAGMELASAGDGVVLGFPAPVTKAPVRLHCTVTQPRLIIDAGRCVGEPEQAMEYVTYPRMRLSGSADGRTVEGEGWFDHQWGGMAWMQSNESPPRLRGWDWLGFTLADGSAWMAALHWDARSGEVFASHLTVRDGAGVVRVIRAFDWQPLRWWTSPSTRVRHPVEWRLTIPELDARLHFTPVADNQEIRIFGPIRAIWEGAGRVRGTVQGQAADAAARLEGHGRGYVFGLSGNLREWSGRLGERWRTITRARRLLPGWGRIA